MKIEEFPGDRSAARGYMPQLDGLRALAIFAVILSHGLGGRFLPFGGPAVRLFFVLSGFLITEILLRCRGYPIASAMRAFYVRRVLRIFPIYYATLAVGALLVPEIAETLGWHAAYLSNVLVVARGAWNDYSSHFWWLCC